MENNSGKSVRVRLKLSTGEEFEAEGDRHFIAQEKDDFLKLLGRKSSAPRPQRQAEETPAPLFREEQTPLPPTDNYITPAYLRKKTAELPPQTPPETAKIYPLEIWERVCKTEGSLVLIRRKSRHLTPQSAALLVLAAAKVLLKQSEYSALSLVKSLKFGGYMEEGERVDRLLHNDIKEGIITAGGYKRGRAYSTSAEGFARAFVLAEKIVKEF